MLNEPERPAEILVTIIFILMLIYAVLVSQEEKRKSEAEAERLHNILKQQLQNRYVTPD